MKKVTIMLAMLVALLGLNSSVLFAGEHGGKEHAGAEQGGTAVEGSHEPGKGHAATIRSAAAILRATHPDLAASLEEVAAEEE